MAISIKFYSTTLYIQRKVGIEIHTSYTRLFNDK